MGTDGDIHGLLVEKLTTRSPLDAADEAAVYDLPISIRDYPRFGRIVREGAKPSTCGFIVSGFAFRSKTTSAGGRQIMALLMPGELIDLQQVVMPRTDHDIEALSAMQVVDIPAKDLQALALSRPAIGRAIWRDIAVEGSITRELVLNNSRRGGVERIAHQLCELAHRLSGTREPLRHFDLPLTQEQLGDMTGLTGVHVNRTLKTLRQRGLIKQSWRTTEIVDWAGLSRLGGFSPDYLHLDGTKASGEGEGDRDRTKRSGPALPPPNSERPSL